MKGMINEMGTRASIVLQGKYSVITLHKIMDGQPKNVLPVLKDAINYIKNYPKRYNSIDKIAQLISGLDSDILPTGRIASDISYIYFVFCLPDEGDYLDVTVKKLKYVTRQETSKYLKD